VQRHVDPALVADPDQQVVDPLHVVGVAGERGADDQAGKEVI